LTVPLIRAEGTLAIDPVPLTDDSVANQQSCLAAANATLRERLRERIERGMGRLGEWLARGEVDNRAKEVFS
jgi:hypothetical protein